MQKIHNEQNYMVKMQAKNQSETELRQQQFKNANNKLEAEKRKKKS